LVIFGGLWLGCDSKKPSGPNKIPIAITSPAPSAIVSDTVNITTAVGADYSFSRVDFYIDSHMAYSDSSLPFSYKWYTGDYYDHSPHSLFVIAYDSQIHESNTINVTVVIPGGPISILSPLSGYAVRDSVRVVARKAAAYSFQRVVFYVNADSVAYDTSATDTTIGVPTKIYSFTINAHDYLDNSTLILRARGVIDTGGYFDSQTETIYTAFNPLPDTLQFISFFSTAAPALRVASEGGHLYIAAGSNAVYGVDVSNINSPSPEFTLNTGDQALGLDIDYPYLVVADRDQGVKRYLVSNPDSVRSEGIFNTSGQSWNVKISDSLLFVADNDALQILIILRGNDSLISMSRVAMTGGLAKDVAAIGTVAYVVDNTGLTVVDASLPAAPVVKSRFLTISGIGLCVSAIDTFVFVGTTSELVKLSIADPETVKFISRQVSSNGPITGVFATDSVVYVSIGGSSGGAMVLDYRSNDAMTVINRYVNSDNCHDICAVGPFIFLAGQTKVDILRFIR